MKDSNVLSWLGFLWMLNLPVPLELQLHEHRDSKVWLHRDVLTATERAIHSARSARSACIDEAGSQNKPQSIERGQTKHCWIT